MNGLTDRLLAIVELLQGQRKLTTQALAEHFGVSERTIRRDLIRLQDLDIDLEILPGRNGGVKLLKGALLQAVRFTDDEALVLALGLKQTQQMGNPQLAKAAASAFRRLEHVLTEKLGERIDSVLQTLTTEPTENLAVEQIGSSTVLDVSEAVQQRQRLEVRYRSRSSGFTYRKLDPYGVVHVNKHWYVAGYCYLRKDVRTFRLDRLEILKATDENFELSGTFDAFKVISDSLAQAPSPGSVTCRIWLQTTLLEASKHIPSYIAMLEPYDDGILLTRITPPKWLWRVALYLLEFPFPVKVLEPPELQTALVALSRRTETLSRGECA